MAKKSFWRAAARHKDVHTTIAFASGQTLIIPLRKNGYLAAFRLNINGTVTPGLAAGTAQDPDNLINLLPFIGIKSAQGAYLHSYSMRDLFDYNYRLHSVVSPLTDPTYAMYAIGTAAAQPVNFTLEVPLSLNCDLNVETGLVLRQIPNSEFYMELRCAQQGDLVGTGTGTITAFNLTITLEEIWFEAVGADATAPAFNTAVRLRSQQFSPMNSNGTTEFKYPVQPTILDCMSRVLDGGVASLANHTQLALIANHQNQVEMRRTVDIRSENYRAYGKPFRNGVLLQDFTDDSGLPNSTRSRDFVNSQAAAELNFVHTTGAAFNSTNSGATLIFRELVPLGVYR
ncbi:MAG: hypothetical protein IAI50_15455 [Candidatus Eremiobacteraeota bacterium]|nr:hypothetical protein [Candidatus Eremiobacteraeota bacterium]